jgi:hypothetical protein
MAMPRSSLRLSWYSRATVTAPLISKRPSAEMLPLIVA